MSSIQLSKSLRKNILKQISPNSSEIKLNELCVQEFYDVLLSCISKLNTELNIDVNIIFGGSYAKGTYIKGDFDVDTFFQFKQVISDINKTQYIEKILKEASKICNINYEKEQGSRIYFSGEFYSKNHNISISFECVPTQYFNSINDVENSTDLSIYHVDYVLKEKEKLRKQSIILEDEIRLAKMWFKSKHLYGAESYINGFSGHSIECLVIYFKTFEKVLEFLMNCEKEALVSMNVNWEISKISKDKYSPIIIQDPIVIGRNALSALSKEIFYKAKYETVLHYKNGFLENDFILKNKSLQEIKKDFFQIIKKNFRIEFSFSFTKSLESGDIIGSKAKKIILKISKELSLLEFRIIKVDFKYIKKHNLALAYIEVVEKELSPIKYVKGPNLDLNEDIILTFLNAHDECDIELIQQTLFVRKPRSIISLIDFLNMYNSTQKLVDTFLSKEFKSLKKIDMKIT